MPGSTITEAAFKAKVLELRGLAKTSSDSAAALAALEALQAQAVPQLEVYNDVFSCCVVSADWARALRVLTHLVSVAGTPPTLDTYKAGLDAIHQIKEGGGKDNWDKALKLYEAMLAAKVQPDGRAIEGVLLALAQANMHDRALEIIQEAAALGVAPTKWMYKIALGFVFQPPPPAVGKGGGGKPPFQTPDYYAARLEALYGGEKEEEEGEEGKEGQFKQQSPPKHKLDDAAAVYLVEEAFKMRRLSLRAVDPILSLFLRDVDETFSESAFLMVISLCKTIEALDPALLVLAAMVEAGKANVLAFNMVLKICEKRGDARRALLLFEQMEVAGHAPDLVSYNTVVSACAKDNKPKEAQRLLGEMEGRGISPSLISYNSLIAALAQGGRWKEAMDVLNVLKRKGLLPDIYTFTGLIQACSKGKPAQVRKALFFLDAMKAAGVRPDAVAYSAAIEACARAGPGTGFGATALFLYEELLSEGFQPQPQVYRAMVQACGNDVEAPAGPTGAGTEEAKETDKEGGGKYVATTEQVWSLLQSCPPQLRNNFVYSAAIKACERGRDWAMALRLLEDMRAIRLEPDDITYGIILHVLSSTGRSAEALSVLQSIKRRNVRHYTSAIRACSAAALDAAPQEAMALYAQMKEEGLVPDLPVYNVVLQSLKAGAVGQGSTVPDDALALYAEMCGKKKGGKGRGGKGGGGPSRPPIAAAAEAAAVAPIRPDIVTFTVLISILEKHGRHAEALRVFSDGVQAKVLMTTALDSLWERDLSRLSYQLVRAAIEYALGELVRDFQQQRKAAAGSKEPNVEDLVLITGVDRPSSSSSSSSPGGETRGMAAPSSRDNPETRQGLACLVLGEKGLTPALEEAGGPGFLRLKETGLRAWLEKQQKPPQPKK